MAQETRTFFKYSEDALTQALISIREQNVSIRAASKTFGVPRATLQDRIKGRVREGPRQMGRDTVLTKDEESKLVKWLIDLCKCGFPQKKSDLLDTVENIVTADKRQTPFTNNRPGEKWYKCFLRRHPELSLREPEGLTKGRAVITEEYIRKWFADLKAYLEETNNLDIISDPERILNGDESGFNLCPKTGKVLGPKGATNILEIKRGNDKENITTLLVFTASGKTAVPCVVFKYVRIPKAIIDSSDPAWHITKSDSGWMKSHVFFEYVSTQLLPWLQSQNIKFPVIFFVDGHKSHLTMELSQFCERSGIILYSLPPNTTHMMQPADVAVFKPLKSEWKKVTRQWLSKPENIHSAVTKTTFCPLLKTVLEKPSLPEYITKGFKKCGLFPFDPDAVDYTKCVQNYLESVVNNEFKEDEITDEEINIAKKVLLTKFEDRLAENFTIHILVQQLERFKTVPGFREEIDENIINYEPPEIEPEENNEDPAYHTESLEEPNEWLSIDDIPIIFVNDMDDNSISERMSDGVYVNGDENNVQEFLTDGDKAIERKIEKKLTSLPNNTSTASDETKSKIINICTEKGEAESTAVLISNQIESVVDSKANIENSTTKKNITSTASEEKNYKRINISTEKKEPEAVTVSKTKQKESLVDSKTKLENSTTEVGYPEKCPETGETNLNDIVHLNKMEMADRAIDEVNKQEPLVTTGDKKLPMQEKSFDANNHEGCNILPSELQQTDFHAVNPPDKPVTIQKINILQNTKLNIPIETHLFYPTPIVSKRRRNMEPQPAAISSPKYRAYLKEKSAKTTTGKIQKKGKKPKIKTVEKKSKERCWGCKEELDSDLDEGDEEHVGCDNCPKWYHIKCTGLLNTSISELKQEYFKCDAC